MTPLNTENNLPRYDGDVTPYFDLGLSPGQIYQGTGCQLRRLLWINGMWNDPIDHLTHGKTLARVIEGHAWGVFNQIGGMTTSMASYIERVRTSDLFAGQYIGGQSYTIDVTAPASQAASSAPSPVRDVFGRVTGAAQQGASAVGISTKYTLTLPRIPVKDLVVWLMKYTWLDDDGTVSNFALGIDALDPVVEQAGCPPPGDVLQCIGDWITNVSLLPSACSILPPKPYGMPDDVYQKLTGDGTIPRLPVPLGDYLTPAVKQLVELYLAPNAATLSLFRTLVAELPFWPMSTILIVCHSQGNLITSNALCALKIYLGSTRQSWQRAVTVFAIASPAVTWPAGVRVRFYTHADDFVTWFSLGRSYLPFFGGNSKPGEFVRTTPSSQTHGPVPDARTHAFQNYVTEDSTSKPGNFQTQQAMGSSQFARDLRQACGLPPVPTAANTSTKVTPPTQRRIW